MILADVPVGPDRQTARAWAQEELAKREYAAERPGPIQLLVRWISHQLDRIPAPEGIDIRLGVTVALLLVVLLMGYVLWRAGGVHRRAKARPRGVFEEPDRTADDHRRASDAAEAAGDLRTALLERFRAIARSLADRALVELVPGVTADEIARRGGTRLPELGADLAAAARAFDDVRYGDRPATHDAVRALRALDDRAVRTTPVAATSPFADRPVAPL